MHRQSVVCQPRMYRPQSREGYPAFFFVGASRWKSAPPSVTLILATWLVQRRATPFPFFLPFFIPSA